MESKARSVRAEQARLSGAMRRDGCSWRQVADEFVRRWGITYLQAFRLVHSFSQEQAAERYNARWNPERPLTGKYISYWEMWPSKSGKEPSLSRLSMLADVYECSVSDLLADVGENGCRYPAHESSLGKKVISWPGGSRKDSLGFLAARMSRAEEFSSWQTEYTDLVRDLRDWALSMRRRDLLAILSAAAGAAYAAPLWNSVLPEDRQRIEAALTQPRLLDESTVTHMEGALYHTMRQEDTLGPQAVIQAALGQQSLALAVLKGGSEGAMHRRLLCLYSNASRFIGWNLFNLSDFEGAARYYELARSAAHEADDDLLTSFALCTWSHLATWSGDPRLGVEHALGAMAWASRAGSNLLGAYADDVSARAYAALIRRSDGTASIREQSECRAALDRARCHLSAAGADDSASQLLYFYGPGQLLVREAECLLELHAERESTQAALDALRALNPEFTRNIAFCRLALAEARAREGELHEAGRELKSAAELAVRNMSLRLRQSIAATRARVSPGTGCEFSEVDEFLRDHQLAVPGEFGSGSSR